jgi:hypothetical protein
VSSTPLLQGGTERIGSSVIVRQEVHFDSGLMEDYPFKEVTKGETHAEENRRHQRREAGRAFLSFPCK